MVIEDQNYYGQFYNRLLILTDNLNVLFYIRKGRCKWQVMHLNHHYKKNRLIETLETYHGLTVGYIVSVSNLAGRLSRIPMDWNQFKKISYGLDIR